MVEFYHLVLPGGGQLVSEMAEYVILQDQGVVREDDPAFGHGCGQGGEMTAHPIRIPLSEGFPVFRRMRVELIPQGQCGFMPEDEIRREVVQRGSGVDDVQVDGVVFRGVKGQVHAAFRGGLADPARHELHGVVAHQCQSDLLHWVGLSLPDELRRLFLDACGAQRLTRLLLSSLLITWSTKNLLNSRYLLFLMWV